MPKDKEPPEERVKELQSSFTDKSREEIVKALKASDFEVGKATQLLKKQGKDNKSKKSKQEKELTEPGERLALLKTKRVFFLPLFLCGCVWIFLYSDPCAVKKKADCGYSGISAMTCRTMGAYLLEGTMTKQKIEIKRQPDTKLGIALYTKDAKGTTIRSIVQGAVADHNSALPWGSNQTVRVGDRIVKANGASGTKGIEKELKSKKSTTVTLEIMRRESGKVSSYVPSVLLSKLPYNAVQVITSPGLDQWLHTFSYMGGIGMAFWALSGYSPASLPFYYLGPSALVAWQSVRCCYNDSPSKQGDPHCYCGAGDSFTGAVKKAWEKTTWKQTEKFFSL